MTTVAAVDRSMMLGLDTVVHREPSTIRINTRCRSKGKMPDGFLYGAGAPEEFITDGHAWVGRPCESRTRLVFLTATSLPVRQQAQIRRRISQVCHTAVAGWSMQCDRRR
jgi:hypothetical protein